MTHARDVPNVGNGGSRRDVERANERVGERERGNENETERVTARREEERKRGAVAVGACVRAYGGGTS